MASFGDDQLMCAHGLVSVLCASWCLAGWLSDVVYPKFDTTTKREAALSDEMEQKTPI